jgi:hypothetical protein
MTITIAAAKNILPLRLFFSSRKNKPAIVPVKPTMMLNEVVNPLTNVGVAWGSMFMFRKKPDQIAENRNTILIM